ncbi:MAG: hypothetical protein KKB20_28940 [Proteobacteria bacterium]|nr:hypothetical protein [Pseudomonadota bacterium]
MHLFDEIIRDIRDFMDTPRAGDPVRRFSIDLPPNWPPAGPRDIVLKADLGVELGGPSSESAAFLVWTGDPMLVQDGRMTLIGPDLDPAAGPELSFGKVMLLAARDFDEENSYDRFRRMSQVRFDVSPKGCMMRAVGQAMREWRRVSREALERGFSLVVLGRALASAYRALGFVEKVEILFVTAGPEAVRGLADIGRRAQIRLDALTRMAGELIFDCRACEYKDLCDQVDDLKAMRRKRMGGRPGVVKMP